MKNAWKKTIWMLVIGGTIGCVLLWTSQLVAQKAMPLKQESLDKYYKELELFTDALSIIKNEYVDELEPKTLVYGALNGMLAALDSHSQFMDPKIFGEMKVDTSGKFGGLGMELTIKDRILTVVSVLEDAPAAKEGLKPLDRIIKINGELTDEMNLMQAIDCLRGAPGTRVDLVIYRESTNEILEIAVVRKVIQIESIKNTALLEKGIGYIRITEFQEMSAKDMETALKTLSKEGMRSLIIDVRNNPGGLLEVSVDVTELFIPENKLIVYTKGRVKEQNMEFRSKPGKKYLSIPLVMLVDEGSASGAEIMAGAIQDHKRGILLGKKTFGKGSVQTVIPLSDGSAMRLTTSKYFTPSGRSIHGNGIMPDVEVDSIALESPSSSLPQESKKDKVKEIFKKFNTKKKEATDKKVQYDPQLARAVDLMKALMIYENCTQPDNKMTTDYEKKEISITK